MSRYEKICNELINEPKTWLITGVAGFIGSNLLEKLLKLNQKIVGIDNFVTGNIHNLEEVRSLVSKKIWNNFEFHEGDIKDLNTCKDVVKNCDYILHQAALGSVPRSINDPISTNAANISGFLNILYAAKEADVSSFTYAASSSTYGDHLALPKVEDIIGNPLSPYAVTKYVNELYADVFNRSYGFKSIGLRYFNVFGKRQDPYSAYAAVIPKWISAMINNKEVVIYGDGNTSRDFCYIENVIQANILAATIGDNAKNQVYNCAVGDRTTLNELFNIIKIALAENGINKDYSVVYKDFRAGDVKHSQADISKAANLLGYIPEWPINEGIKSMISWYLNNQEIK